MRLIRAVLSVLLSDAVDDGIILANAALQLRGSRRRRPDSLSQADRQKKIRPMDHRQLAGFLAAAETDSRHYPLFLLLARTGMRPGEAYALQWGDLDFRARELRIERSLSAGQIETPKTGQTRTVDMSAQVAALLVQQVEALNSARPGPAGATAEVTSYRACLPDATGALPDGIWLGLPLVARGALVGGPLRYSEMPDERVLRAKARAAVESDKIPGRRPDRTWRGPGVGAACAVCDEPVTSHQLEFEIRFSRDGDNPGLDKFHVHIRCFAAWEFERRQGGTAPHS